MKFVPCTHFRTLTFQKISQNTIHELKSWHHHIIVFTHIYRDYLRYEFIRYNCKIIVGFSLLISIVATLRILKYVLKHFSNTKDRSSPANEVSNQSFEDGLIQQLWFLTHCEDATFGADTKSNNNQSWSMLHNVCWR